MNPPAVCWKRTNGTCARRDRKSTRLNSSHTVISLLSLHDALPISATKVALNIISTGAMIGLGKVRGNLMIDLHTTSTKLRDRAVRILAELTQRDYESARGLLEANEWNLRTARSEERRVGKECRSRW